MAEITTPDGRLLISWGIWRTSQDLYDDDKHWRVIVENAETGAVLAMRHYSHAYSLMTRHESGRNVSKCTVSEDSNTLTIHLDDGEQETIDLSQLELNPRHDSTQHYSLSWTAVSPGGCSIKVFSLPYVHLHRVIELQPDENKAGIHRVAFSNHPGLIVVIREDGTIETAMYGERAWPRRMEYLDHHANNRLLWSSQSFEIGPQGYAGPRRGSIGFWDAITGEQVGLFLGKPIESVVAEDGFDFRVRFEDSQQAVVSALDHLLPFGAFQLNQDRTRVLRFLSTVANAERDRSKTIRWSLIEVLDARDASELHRCVITSPYARREDETLTVSDFHRIPEGHRLESEQSIRSVRFPDHDEGMPKLRATLWDGTEMDLLLSRG